MRICCVAGARPNYMKVKPVMDALEERGAEVVLVHTGQHYDAARNDVFFSDLGIRPPDHYLQVGSGSHATQTGEVMAAFEPLLGELDPDVVVVVGDVNSTLAATLVAAKLDIAHWRGDMKPADKIALIEDLKHQGHRVLMVGDGLNDAPSVAAAHVSLSPISAPDVTQAQADAVFLGDRLAPVVGTVTIARRARRLMTENLWLAVIYNMIAVPVAIAGAVTPLIAALAMSGSSLLVTLNALRARKGDKEAVS